MRGKSALKFASILVLGSLTLGCGGPKPVKVSGVLTLNGEPVEGANVQFVPADDGKRPASGITDKTGKFELTCFESKDGALPGDYKVVITYTPPVETEPGGKTEQVMKKVMEIQKKEARKKPKYSIPKEFASAMTTTLKQKVPTAGPVTIELKN